MPVITTRRFTSHPLLENIRFPIANFQFPIFKRTYTLGCDIHQKRGPQAVEGMSNIVAAAELERLGV
jgi:hypothetical protein